MSFPSATPSYAASDNSMTLDEFNHLTRHITMQTDIIALANKLGISASTPVDNAFLVGNGDGTSLWEAAATAKTTIGLGNVDNTSDATKNAATVTLTNKTLTSPILTTPALGTPSALVLTNASGQPASIDLVNATNLGNANLLTTAGDVGGAWKAWTPSFTGITLGSAANTGFYTRIGKTIHFKTATTFAANTSVTGGVTLTLPVANKSAVYMPIGLVNCNDAPYVEYWGHIMGDGQVYVDNAAGTYVGYTALSSTVPMTWTTGDILYITGTYESV